MRLCPRTIIRNVHVYQTKSLTGDAIRTSSTHNLLQSLGYIKQTQSGLVHWLPLGLRTLNKITSIIKHRMETDGKAEEVSLSLLSPKSLWVHTNRWNNSELFKLKDSKGSDYCLAPTCEEEITSLVGSCVTSYKDLPMTVYQVGRKYRDEKRPRGGLLRGREFLMKDAYSFDASKEEAVRTFESMNNTYDLIFKDLGVPFVSAWADSGDIGGDMSKEYHYVHESGEDTVMACDSCGHVSNVEKCSSFPIEDNQYSGNVSVRYALSEDRDTLLCLYYPQNRVLNWNLVKAALDGDVDSSLRDTSNEQVLELFRGNRSEDEMMLASVLRVMDCRLNSRSNYPDFPLNQYLKSNFSQLSDASIVDAEAGELCGSCEEGYLSSKRSIEVGHTFYLGQKYSEPLNAKFSTRENTEEYCEMGCYGIGVSRLVGAIAHVTRDGAGLRWPRAVAPYEISICAAKQDELLTEVEDLLSSWGREVWVNRDEKAGLGRKVAASHSLGIPVCVIVGKKSWPYVEIEVRAPLTGEHWRAALEQYGEAWGWTLQESAPGSAPPARHRVRKEHLKDVVGVILTDM
ncbi:LAQU0S05e02190g1_1 [Lachancea quebecensis]|uniref:proline--tRNA ligase n=1 Tax=Lachancea quebecensis TaxID=1654605 RepID=A0A0P1KYG7_9SACH|nr:LAQU0S05e02190g1_1 [Lachancea quebecensis]